MTPLRRVVAWLRARPQPTRRTSWKLVGRLVGNLLQASIHERLQNSQKYLSHVRRRKPFAA